MGPSAGAARPGSAPGSRRAAEPGGVRAGRLDGTVVERGASEFDAGIDAVGEAGGVLAGHGAGGRAGDDAGDDRGELEEGEADVPGQGRQVGARARRVPLGYLAPGRE